MKPFSLNDSSYEDAERRRLRSYSEEQTRRGLEGPGVWHDDCASLVKIEGAGLDEYACLKGRPLCDCSAKLCPFFEEKKGKNKPYVRMS